MFGHAPPPQWGDFVQCPKSGSLPTLQCEPFTTKIHSQALVESLDPPSCAAASPQSLSPLVNLSDSDLSPTNDNVYLYPQRLAVLLASGAAPACSLVEELKSEWAVGCCRRQPRLPVKFLAARGRYLACTMSQPGPAPTRTFNLPSKSHLKPSLGLTKT